MKDIALLSNSGPKESKQIKPKANDWLWLKEVSFAGWMLMGLNILIAASAFTQFRIPVGGFLMHLYIIPLIPLLILYAVNRVTLFPQKILIGIVAFILLFFLSIVVSDSFDSKFVLSEIFKIGVSFLTLFTCALMIRNKLDFRAAVIGACVAAATLSFRNVLFSGSIFSLGSLSELENAGNKNAFSMYVLPALLLGSFVVLDKTAPKILRIFLFICLMITTVAIFAGGNRSGWLCALIIGVVIFGRGRSIKAMVLIIILAAGTYYTLTKYIGTETFERRLDQTTTENSSDTNRFDLIYTSFEVATEYPLFGVSPQELPYELGRRLPDEAVLDEQFGIVLDPHNVIAFIMAGSGFTTLFALIFVGWAIWERPAKWKDVLSHVPDVRESHIILRTMLILWIARGMFTREILYSPSFCAGLGLSIGFCISQGLWLQRAVQFYRISLTLQKIRGLK